MPEQKDFSSTDNKSNSTNDTKKWRGIKQDPKSGQFIVYITESSDRVFDTIDEAVDYMTKADSKTNIVVEAGSPEFSGVQRGQENIDGVKQVTITRKIVEDEDGKWKVREKTRTDLIKDDEESAKSAYNNIDDAKEEAEYVENPFDEEDEVEKKSSLEPLGTCANCGASIYPPGQDMAPWFNRQIPADLLCPACGYGIGEPTNFIYSNNELNEENIDKMSSVEKKAESKSFSFPLKYMEVDIDKEFLKKVISENGFPMDDSVLDINYEFLYENLKWSFDLDTDNGGVGSFIINFPEQQLEVHFEYEYGGNEEEEPEEISGDVKFSLNGIDSSASSINLDSSSLYPQRLNIYSDGSALVEF